jgi:5-methylcytosine-specific restriction endonuclease McrA
MTSGTQTLAAASTLGAARRLQAEADAAQAGVLEQVLAWATLHLTDDEDDVATWGDAPVALAGEGAPQVSEFCVDELGAVLGLSRTGARSMMADVIELGYRLPKTLAKVHSGKLKAWKARRIAERTQVLSLEAAAFVDGQVAPFAHRVSLTELERLVESAIATFMPDYAAEVAAKAADGRFVEIDHEQASFAGTSLIRGELDLADALDLETALQAGAAQLKDLGSEESLGARRSIALGALARGDQQLDLEPARDVVLYVHLDPDQEQARLENGGNHLLSAEQIKLWCRTAAKITVRPVIDLAQTMTTGSYQPTDTLREQVIARDRTCTHPYCNRRARAADLDHIEPYDPDGPSDQTSSANLAPLCRYHHRLKTFSSWTYTQLEPGVFLWRSPHGYQFLRDQTGTRDVTPRPVDPPGS